MRPVVLDTDIGVDPDDSFAILLLERTLQQQQRERERKRKRKRRDGGDGAPGSEHDPVRLVGVTTVGSFVGIKTALARFYLCNLLGIHTTPVFRGSDRSVTGHRFNPFIFTGVVFLAYSVWTWVAGWAAWLLAAAVRLIRFGYGASDRKRDQPRAARRNVAAVLREETKAAVASTARGSGGNSGSRGGSREEDEGGDSDSSASIASLSTSSESSAEAVTREAVARQRLADAAAHGNATLSAAEALVELSHVHGGALEIICIGPLTNVALAIAMDPSFLSRVRSVSVMGGVLGGVATDVPLVVSDRILGEQTDTNLRSDRAAFHSICTAYARLDATARPTLTLIPLDVTVHCKLNQADALRLTSSFSHRYVTHWLYASLRLWARVQAYIVNTDVADCWSLLHDPLTAIEHVNGGRFCDYATVLYCPDAKRFRPDGLHLTPPPDDAPGIPLRIATAVNAPAFVDHCLALCARP